MKHSGTHFGFLFFLQVNSKKKAITPLNVCYRCGSTQYFLCVLLKGRMTADECIFLKRSEVTIFTELGLLKTEIVRLRCA